MPKIDDKDSAASRLSIENRTELRKKVAFVNAKGTEVETIDMILNKQDNAEPSP
jgi:hypothetical protein